MVWIRRIVIVGVFGYALAEAGLLLGMTRSAHDALLKGIGLVLHSSVAIIILQKRHVVAGWIRGPAEASGTIAALRRRTAAIWHWIALFYLVALWLVWAVEIREGFSRLLHFFIVTSLTIVMARVALIILLGNAGPEPAHLARGGGALSRARATCPLLLPDITGRGDGHRHRPHVRDPAPVLGPKHARMADREARSDGICCPRSRPSL